MRFVFFAWIACIVLFSIAPIPVKDMFHTRGHWHYVAHFAVFLSSAVLFCWKSRSTGWKIASCAGLLLLALLVEALEVLIYRNHFEWLDVAVDSAGVILGLLLIFAAEALAGSERAAPGT